ncbi:MAG: Fe-S cluster assembly protein SufD [Muribaculaceae bacterium]|nr:Fe-S cluster assembly protein SufD [Muribaculaceae bacterium]
MKAAQSFGQYLALWVDNEALRQGVPEPLATLNSAGAEALPALIEAYRAPKDVPRACAADELFAPDYGVNLAHHDMHASVAEAFHCGVPNLNSHLVVVANDVVHVSAPLRDEAPAGLKVYSLRSLPSEYVGRAGELLALHSADNVAVAMNSLLLGDGIYIRVEPGVTVERPVQIVNIFHSDMPMLSSRRVVVDAGEGASLRVLLCDHSQGAGVQHLNNQVVQVHAAPHASVDLYDIEESSADTHRLNQLFTHQEHDSRVVVSPTFLHGGVTANHYGLNLTGDHAEAEVTGLAICADKQQVANNVVLRHDCEHSTSRQLFKYALYDEARGSFGGKVVVEHGARFTDASQTNRNILVSEKARMDASPQLEIYCDEVKASHGATTGQLDERALFYMQARGIPADEAERMLTQAFMADVVDNIGYEVLRQRMHVLVEKRLAGASASCETCASADCSKYTRQ